MSSHNEQPYKWLGDLRFKIEGLLYIIGPIIPCYSLQSAKEFAKCQADLTPTTFY